MRLAGRLCLFLSVGVIGCSPPEQRHALKRRELVLERLATAIARAEPVGPVLVIGNPFVESSGADASILEAEAAAVRGVERGLGNAARLLGVVHPELRPEAMRDPQSVPIPAGATTPLSFLTSPGAWDRLRKGHPTARVWVSLIGLPADLAETRAWTDASGPKWALFLPDLRLIGPADALRAAFDQKRVIVVVLNRPGAPPESAAPERDPVVEFERRYLLITGENLEEMLRAWPGVFG